jgi:hypothetical protein
MQKYLMFPNIMAVTLGAALGTCVAAIGALSGPANAAKVPIPQVTHAAAQPSTAAAQSAVRDIRDQLHRDRSRRSTPLEKR